METNAFMQTAHLLLGITREELKRRIASGIVDPEILKSQVEQHSEEVKLEATSEKIIELNSLEQIDIFSEE